MADDHQFKQAHLNKTIQTNSKFLRIYVPVTKLPCYSFRMFLGKAVVISLLEHSFNNSLMKLNCWIFR